MNSRFAAILAPIAVATSLSLVASPAASAGTGTSGIDNIEKSIVLLDVKGEAIVQYMSGGKLVLSDPIKAEGTCTGEWVSQNADILTAGHCVDQDELRSAIISKFMAGQTGNGPGDPAGPGGQNGHRKSQSDLPTPDPSSGVSPDQIVNVMGPNGPGSKILVTVTATQTLGVPGAVLTGEPAPVTVSAAIAPSDGDLALLHATPTLPPTPVLPVALSSPEDGAGVIAVGYPGVLSDSMKTKYLHPSKYRGSVSAHQPKSPIGDWPSLEMDVKELHGMSGGPILNGKFQLVGTVDSGIPDEDGGDTVSYATDTPQVRQFLQGHGITLK